MTNLGFKKLTEDNWLEPDKNSSLFVSISPIDGQTQPITGNDWVRDILRINLTEEVSQEIQALFEVARGALVYGYFFYPLYTLAAEQLFRVVEAAVTLKCVALKAPSSIKNFQRKIDYLIKEKIISEREKEAWHAIRKLRNSASHALHQNIITPGMAIGNLYSIADKINALFRNV